MPANNRLQLHVNDKTANLFLFAPDGDALLSTKLLQAGSINLFPLYKDCIYKMSPSTSCYRVTLEIEEFQNLLLSDDTLNDITYTWPQNQHSNDFSFFTVRGKTLQDLSQLSKTNATLVSSSGGSNSYALNYTFPSSFLTDSVRRKLQIGQRKQKSNTEDEKTQKVRLTPAHKIYDRVLNDPSVDEGLFVIGFIDRFSGILETPFSRFVTLDNEKHYNTSIPFHRVRYFKYKGNNIVWDREKRIDLLRGNKFVTLCVE